MATTGSKKTVSAASPGGAPGRRSTIRDVARQAGVSVATVSRVLAGNYPVTHSTRTKVLRAVRQLDYVANAHAKALAGSGVETIALVLDDITWPAFAQIGAGVEQEAARRGRLCLVCTTQGDQQRELAVVNLMREQHAAAVILVGGLQYTAEYRERMGRFARSLDSVGSRLVLCGRPPIGEGLPVTVVEYDNEGGAYVATAHLLGAGHRRILFLGGERGQSTATGRLAGHERALAAYGLEPDPELLTYADFSRESGLRRVREAVRASTSFTAVFAATDMVALGALEGLREAGLRVPEDVSLVGYDDIPVARELTPRLTTVHVPFDELGRTAARLVLDRREGVGGGGDRVLLGTHVSIRDSTAPPPAAPR
ncbi:LacI family DNA-binding transcriptional regulator [Streptomyces litchfieldiae]|uniref:LacI family DNA-binding transcriptional regulator n=1 Tax=Streptomyces litchfieldiae TaxID=3075543 RepID=A0ABU2MUN2_9ACTN|nr:LacI family DNA-binding transcriptional regulator [Streptomyces sp. DSM 44938]MDT0344259.1 LacI family DNA-binding transcriptional regulator [Streptomyces sp. DSM 44938]